MATKNNKKSVNGFLKFRLGLQHRININERLKSYTEEEFPVYESLLKFKSEYMNKKKDLQREDHVNMA